MVHSLSNSEDCKHSHYVMESGHLVFPTTDGDYITNLFTKRKLPILNYPSLVFFLTSYVHSISESSKEKYTNSTLYCNWVNCFKKETAFFST